MRDLVSEAITLSAANETPTMTLPRELSERQTSENKANCVITSHTQYEILGVLDKHKILLRNAEGTILLVTSDTGLITDGGKPNRAKVASLLEQKDQESIFNEIKIASKVYKIRGQLSKQGLPLVLLCEDDKGELCILKKKRDELHEYYAASYEARNLIPLPENKLSIYKIDPADSDEWLVTNFIKGKPLASYMEEDLNKLSPAERIAKIIDISKGLLELLAAINIYGLYNDLKVGNIVIGDDGKPAIIDIDLLVLFNNPLCWHKKSGYTFLPGTLKTMAPEIIVDEKREVNSDLYSLGIAILGLLPVAIIDTLVGENILEKRDGFNDSIMNLIYSHKKKTRLPYRKTVEVLYKGLKEYPAECQTQVARLYQFILATTQNDPSARPQTAKKALEILEGKTKFQLSFLDAHLYPLLYSENI